MHVADLVSNAMPGTSRHELEKYKRRGEEQRYAGVANPRAFDAAVQDSNLRAVLGALREYTTSVGHVQAAHRHSMQLLLVTGYMLLVPVRIDLQDVRVYSGRMSSSPTWL